MNTCQRESVVIVSLSKLDFKTALPIAFDNLCIRTLVYTYIKMSSLRLIDLIPCLWQILPKEGLVPVRQYVVPSGTLSSNGEVRYSPWRTVAVLLGVGLKQSSSAIYSQKIRITPELPEC